MCTKLAGLEAGSWPGIQRLTRASAALQSTDAGMWNREELQGLVTQTNGLGLKAQAATERVPGI